MVILRSQNKITDFLMILAWDSPFKIDPIFSNGNDSFIHVKQKNFVVNLPLPPTPTPLFSLLATDSLSTVWSGLSSKYFRHNRDVDLIVFPVTLSQLGSSDVDPTFLTYFRHNRDADLILLPVTLSQLGCFDSWNHNIYIAVDPTPMAVDHTAHVTARNVYSENHND